MRRDLITRRSFVKSTFIAAAMLLAVSAGAVYAGDSKCNDNPNCREIVDSKMFYDHATRTLIYPNGNLMLQMLIKPEDVYDDTDFRIIEIDYDGVGYAFSIPGDFIISKDSIVVLTKYGSDIVAEATHFEIPLVVVVDKVSFVYTGTDLTLESSNHKTSGEIIYYNLDSGVLE